MTCVQNWQFTQVLTMAHTPSPLSFISNYKCIGVLQTYLNLKMLIAIIVILTILTIDGKSALLDSFSR